MNLLMKKYLLLIVSVFTIIKINSQYIETKYHLNYTAFIYKYPNKNVKFKCFGVL